MVAILPPTLKAMRSNRTGRTIEKALSRKGFKAFSFDAVPRQFQKKRKAMKR